MPVTAESLLDIWKGLVFQGPDGTVKFTHVTMVDFLQSHYASELLSKVDIAKTCLAYLAKGLASKSRSGVLIGLELMVPS